MGLIVDTAQKSLTVHVGEIDLATDDEVLETWRARMNARQRILGHEVVSARKDVIDFRREYLPDGLLDPDDRTVRAWLNKQKRLAGEFGGDAELRSISVSAQEPTDEPIEVVARDSLAIAGLSSIPDALFADYRWMPQPATRWLIARDAKPVTPNVVADVYKSEKSDEEGRPWYAYVTMEFPIDFPSGHAAQIIEDLQRDVKKKGFAFDPSTHEPTTRRPTTQRNSEIAAFCALRNDGKRSWGDVLQEWNEAHPDEVFADTRKGRQMFAKTARSAYDAIMGPNRSLVWKTTDNSK